MICTHTEYYWGDKTRKMRLAERVARTGIQEVHIGFWWGNERERDLLADLGAEGLILKWICEK
jgi:hypothetical protein